MTRAMLLAVLVIGTGIGETQAQTVQPIPDARLKRLGEKLATAVESVPAARPGFAFDAARALGFQMSEQAIRVVVIPRKDLNESEAFAAEMKTEAGAPIGSLFFEHVAPIVKGALASADRVPEVSLADEFGIVNRIRVLRLVARQVSDEDYRLYAYGTGKEPLIDAKFAIGSRDVKGPVHVAARDVDTDKRRGTLVVTVFGKYEASFPGAYAD
ncbi:MAG: hypothetical protein FJ297_06640 [Planctomycetes bacterium]|nr:hypothetical protein [Planctomycetota bacterium]